MHIVECRSDPTGHAGSTPATPHELARRIPGLGPIVRAEPDRPDILIVRAGADGGGTDAAVRRAGHALSRAVGSLLVQDAAGAVERDVFDRGQDPGPMRYSASRVAAPMHTDGMHMPDQDVPGYFSLTCLQPAASGGELSCVHLDDVLRTFAERAHAERVLAREYWFHTKGVDPRGRMAVCRRVLETGRSGAPEIQFAREYIDLGHDLPHAPDLDAEALDVLAELDDILTRTDLHHSHRLDRGDVALIDNRRVLHSRTAFENEPGRSPRRMMRLWIRREPE